MEMRINKFLSEAGVCSRRAADKLIEDNKVLIDGVPASLGSKVYDDSVVVCDGIVVSRNEEKIVIAFNKPVGITCTADALDESNIIDYINYPTRLFTIGRLDKESCG